MVERDRLHPAIAVVPNSDYTKKHGHWVHDAIMDIYGAMILRVKARLDAGEEVEDCLAKTLLLEQENEGLDWEDMLRTRSAAWIMNFMTFLTLF
jgi:hypothetical protein